MLISIRFKLLRVKAELGAQHTVTYGLLQASANKRYCNENIAVILRRTQNSYQNMIEPRGEYLIQCTRKDELSVH